MNERIRMGPRLAPGFYYRPCVDVAPELLGSYLVHRLPGGSRRVGRIVEVEAYIGDGTDPASHSHRGETERNRAMFGPAGHLYVYRSYGIHTCANVVCEGPGHSAAVLLRAIEAVAGVAPMRRDRGLASSRPDREIGNGPGKLCQALAITLDHYGAQLARGPLALYAAAPGDPAPDVEITTRIGITKAADLPYRFYDRNSKAVSRR